MVQFKFSGSKSKEKDVPSNYGYGTKDLNKVCVYAHYYDKEDKPFYIGQGKLGRAFNFTNRNNSWNNKVIDKSKVKVNIINIDISIEESIIIEKELIKLYGRLDNNTGILTNENDGGSNSQSGTNNYFYDKHYFNKDNDNYGNKYESNDLSKPVIQIDVLGNIVREWSSATEAAEKGNFQARCISGCCYGKRHIHNGYQWIFKSDYNPNNNYEYIPGKTNNRIYIAESRFNFGNNNNFYIIMYGAADLRKNRFNPRNVSQVINGQKRTHKGFYFIDYFRADKETKLKYLDKIDFSINI